MRRTSALGARLAAGAAALALATAALTAQAAAPSRWIEAGEGRGLPAPDAVWTPFHADPDHPANRVFRALFVVRLQPAEIGRALPREQKVGEAFYVTDWYFAKREGTPQDERWFGGDALQLPRERFSETESAQLIADLAALDGHVLAELKNTPRLAIWLQNDLLRMARRLVDTKSNPELMQPLLRAIERLALPRAELSAAALSTFALEQLPAMEPALSVDRLVELDRRSSILFHAEHTMLWSRVLVQWPVGKKGGVDAYLAAIDAMKKGDPKPMVPLHTRAVLLQGLVAVADDGKPVATPLVVDVRLQHYAGIEPLSPENPTTTHDGTDFRVFWLERQAVREGSDEVALNRFREWHREDEVLFRDYGWLKHTNLGGQCALCHRRTGTPEHETAGFSVLRIGSHPRRVADDGVRLRLAETEAERFVLTLRDLAK